MGGKFEARRPDASNSLSAVVEELARHLRPTEVGRLVDDLTSLSSRPEVFVKLVSFARTMLDESIGGNQPAPLIELIGGGHGPLVDLEEGARRLDAITETIAPERWATSELLGPEAIVERLGVSRSTLHNWRRDARVVALRKGLRNHVYPVRQFAGASPLAGIAGVLALMPDPDEAWEWLVTPNHHTDDEPPLALLERGEAGRVELAAASALDYA